MKPRLATAVAAIALLTGCNPSAALLPRSNAVPVLAPPNATRIHPHDVTVTVGPPFVGAIGIAVDRSGNAYVAYTYRPKRSCVNGNLCGLQGVDKLTPSGAAFPIARKQLRGAQSVAVDKQGNLYVACLTSSNTGIVDKVTSAGAVTRLGSFVEPEGVAVDDAGNVYVSDFARNEVVKLLPKGATKPIAPRGTFFHPQGIATDTRGNVYVADTGNTAVREVHADGTVTAIGGGYTNPVGVAVHGGAVYVVDSQLNAVEETSGGGPLLSIGAGFYQPYGVAVGSDGTVFVADGGNNAVKKIVNRGKLNFVGFGLNRSSGVAIDPHVAVYVADTGHHDVRQIVLPAGYGTPIRLVATGVHPVDVAVDKAANVYVADTAFGAIREFSPNGKTWRQQSSIGGGFKEPSSVAIWFTQKTSVAPRFASIGAFYVADTGNNSVKKIDGSCPTGCVVGGETKFNLPQGVAVDATGNVYVADTGNSQIKEIAGDGSVQVLGGPNYRPYYPAGVAVDGNGDVFVADTGNNTVEELTRVGTHWRVAAIGSGFNQPRGLAVTPTSSGYAIYIADYTGIWKFTL